MESISVGDTAASSSLGTLCYKSQTYTREETLLEPGIRNRSERPYDISLLLQIKPRFGISWITFLIWEPKASIWKHSKVCHASQRHSLARHTFIFIKRKEFVCSQHCLEWTTSLFSDIFSEILKIFCKKHFGHLKLIRLTILWCIRREQFKDNMKEEHIQRMQSFQSVVVPSPLTCAVASDSSEPCHSSCV